MNTTFAANGSSSNLTTAEYHNVAVTIAALSVNSILGLPLNLYVIWLIVAGARGTLASNLFSLNMAVSEIIFAVLSMFYIVYNQWKLLFSFEVFVFSCGFFFTARPLFQCCICVECYVGVVHPVVFLRYKPLRYRVACCCVAWLITLLSCIYSMYNFSNTMYLYGFFAQSLLFFLVMLSSHLSVLRALKRPGPGEKDKEKKKSDAVKRRAFKIILLIMISMAIHVFLYVAVIPLQCCLNMVDFLKVFTISTSLALTTGFTQPLLYLYLCFLVLSYFGLYLHLHCKAQICKNIS